MASLRDVHPEDREKILEWRNLPKVADYMYTDHAISPEEHAAWFSRVLKDPTYKYWVIVCDGEDVGLANLCAIDRINQRCYWGFYIAGTNVRGKGVGSHVEYMILNYVFEELKLEKLCGEVLSFNQDVVDMHSSFGFVQEGLLRKHVLKQGVLNDVVCIGILKDEWAARRPQVEQRLREKGIL